MLLVSPTEEEPSGSNLDIYHNKVMNCLRGIKSTFNPRGRVTDRELWKWMPPDQRMLVSLVVEYEESITKMFGLNDATLPGWENLELWIEKAHQIHRQRMHFCRDLAYICGEDIGNAINMKDLKVKCLESPAKRTMTRTYGPHWQSDFAGILRSYNASGTSLSHLIPRQKCRELTDHRTSKILRIWERLKAREKEGVLDEFIGIWSRLDCSTRLSWLRSRPGVWQSPHQDILTWAGGDTSQLKQLGSSLFLTSLLNAEDLSRPDHLSAFLKARTHGHPQLFRESDSRSVPFGLYAEALPVLKCEGRMIFTNQKIDQDTYEVRVEDSKVSDWSALDPCNGLLSLETQIRIYDFCLSCTPDNLKLPYFHTENISTEEPPPPSTLLSRCYFVDIQSPDTIDLTHIRSLLQASLDEAHDDLTQLRTDEDSWLQRMREIKAENCSSNLLLSLFDRIDTFSALCDLIDEILGSLDSTSSGRIESRLNGHSGTEAVTSLEAVLLSAQNEILSSGKHLRRPSGAANLPLKKLVEVVLADSPLVRIMGLPHVLRVIDREMRSQSEVRHPTPLVHTINDLAVLAFSLNQVTNHYLFTPLDWSGHFQKLEELDDKWKARSRPWDNLVKTALEAIDRETTRKLDVLWTRETIALEERHLKFWTIIDQQIEAVAEQDEESDLLLRILRRTRPTQAKRDDCSREIPMMLPESSPTMTAKQRGKRRTQSVVISSSETSTSVTDRVDADVRPVIPVPMGIKKAWNFWHHLINGGPECPKEFHWQDFMASMAAIGYAQETTTGSVYRFEYIHTAQRHAINFHRPHGNVLNVRQARSQWRDRIMRRIRLELVED